ncbi:AraC family transcriptional regulator [Lacrimispora sp.]|uniref:AraC family transcriptional regulator n=1 Tax=Lacrimispora sp. TaxID=2719234 RepID=UPI003FA585A3
MCDTTLLCISNLSILLIKLPLSMDPSAIVFLAFFPCSAISSFLQVPLLKLTHHSCSSMAGYDDPYYFSNVFKRITQMTPSGYIARN